MTLSPGTRLGPYEIQAAIGAGGMGEVYKAKDTRLDRTIAIKVLPPEFSADPDRRARFEREAKTIAGLNHPHICTLHDVGDHDGSLFLVLEHLTGETLAERLTKGPLPLEQALTIATEIAAALAAAHRQGVIHRDLKPGNVMLTKGGAKLLDFGLAKLKTSGPVEATAAASVLPTRGPATAAGTLVGTVPYMAPEQLEGKEIDARSDIFSFGAVLYEMLTGRRAFQGVSHASVISAIMSSQPPALSSLRPLTPPSLDRLVQRCLEKDPDARWQSATDVAAELRWISTGSGSVPGLVAPADPSRVRSRRWRWIAAVAVLFGVAAVAVAWWVGRRPASVTRREATHSQVTVSGDVFQAALTPDGRTIAYAVADGHPLQISGPGRVLVRDIQGSEALEIWRGEQGGLLAWMPDGQQVLIAPIPRSCEPVLVSRFGGTPRRLEGLRGFACTALAPSPDGSRVAARLAEEAARGYQVLSLASGKTVSRTLPEADYISTLSWNRNSDQLAVVGDTKDHLPAAWVASPSQGSAWRLPQPAGTTLYGACWSPVADALYVLRKRQNDDTAELVRVTFRKPGEVDEEVLLTGLRRSRSCQVSANGQRLLLVHPFSTSNLWRLDLAHPVGPAPLTKGTSRLEEPDVSPDGEWVLVHEYRGAPHLVRVPARGGSPSPFLDQAEYGRWSPDGRRLAFIASRSGTRRIWVADSDGRNAVELPGSELPDYTTSMCWWPDGRLAWQTPDGRNFRIRDLATGRDELLRGDSPVGHVGEPRVSPNGAQVAVSESTNDGPGLWLIGWTDRRERLLAAGELYPIGWAADGRTIYALRFGQPEVLRVSVATGTVETVGRFPGSLGPDMCSITPDRSAIICSMYETTADAWIVDDFDPHVPPAKR